MCIQSGLSGLAHQRRPLTGVSEGRGRRRGEVRRGVVSVTSAGRCCEDNRPLLEKSSKLSKESLLKLLKSHFANFEPHSPTFS